MVITKTCLWANDDGVIPKLVTQNTFLYTGGFWDHITMHLSLSPHVLSLLAAFLCMFWVDVHFQPLDLSRQKKKSPSTHSIFTKPV